MAKLPVDNQAGITQNVLMSGKATGGSMHMKFNLKSNRGFGIIEILVIVVVLGIIGAGIYLYFQQAQSDKNSSGLSKQEQAEIQAACKLEIKDDLLCAAFTQWGEDDDEPVTITTKATGSEESANSTSVMKMDGKNYHTISKMDGGDNYESILLGDMMYTKMNGVWYKQEVSSEEEASSTVPDVAEPEQIADEVINTEKASQVEYKKLGTESCGGTTCVKYQVNDKEQPDELSYFWIDPKKARILRMQSQSDGTSFDMVYEYGPVSITAPEGAKDYSELYNF